MRLALAVTPLAVALLCTGCPREPELVEADYCNAQMPGDTSMLPQRELQLGELVDGTFTPWSDGEHVNLVFGFQGFPMITPWFELPVEADDVDGACWHLLYQRLDANGDVDPSYQDGKYNGGLEFDLVGDIMRAGPLFDITDEGVGQTVGLRATVSSPSFVATRDVFIVIDEESP
jgi:hypothetical protein